MSDPTTNLTMWGATNPTKPRMPVKDTIPAVITAMRIRQNTLKFSTSIPRVLALLSPKDIMFSCLERRNTRMEPTMVISAITGRVSQVT